MAPFGSYPHTFRISPYLKLQNVPDCCRTPRPIFFPRHLESHLACPRVVDCSRVVRFPSSHTLGVCEFPISLTEVCMHHVVSIKRCSLAVVLAIAVLLSPTIGLPDQVYSTASLTNLNITAAGIGITADSVMAEASQIAGSAGTGSSSFSNLSIAGVPINVTGAPNQVVGILGGVVTINEQTISPTGAAVVNALHVTIAGVADLVVASATAGIS